MWLGRSRAQRQMIAGAVAAGLVWLLLLAYTRSALTAMIITLVVTGLVFFAVAARRRGLGRRLEPPPEEATTVGAGQDPVDTFGQAICGLDKILVPGVTGQTYAPTHIEIVLSRSSLAALWQRMDSEYLEEVALSEYLRLVEQRGATLQHPHQASVTIIGESRVPDGSFFVRQRGPASTGGAGVRPSRDGGTTPANAPTSVLPRGRRPIGPQAGPASPGRPAPPATPRYIPGSGPRAGLPAGPRPGPRPGPQPGPRPGPRPGPQPGPPGDLPHTRIAQSGPPRLTLRTGSVETSTTVSPATAGRAAASDLQLPHTDTISRRHAVFTYRDGRWWVENVGTNGLCLNGRPLDGRQPLADRDELRWGTRADATVSTVLLAPARLDPERPGSGHSAQW
jgi:pSer/pThr/pTyr-binding forkhead associated (FHA) protein